MESTLKTKGTPFCAWRGGAKPSSLEQTTRHLQIINKSWECNKMWFRDIKSGRPQEHSGHWFYKTMRHQNTLFRKSQFSSIFQMLTKSRSPAHTCGRFGSSCWQIGIYVENHHGWNRDCFNWKILGHLKSGFWGSTPCYLRTFWFLKLAPWRRVLRTIWRFWRNHGKCSVLAVGLGSSSWQIWNLRRK